MPIQQALSFVILLSLGAFGFWLHGEPGGRVGSFALVSGLALGIVMQRSRFCFYCHLKDYLQAGKPHGVLALLLAIAVGLVGYTVVLGSWLPEPAPGNLPPDIHIGPVSWALAAAGLAFGSGMSISGSCISAHWYRLAEGSPRSPFALLGVVAGFVLGFKSWNGLYSLSVADAPVLWLPAYLGYAGALLLQLAVLALIAAGVWRGFARRNGSNEVPAGERLANARETPSLAQIWRRLWRERWAWWTGGLMVGLIGALVIVRMNPLGATAPLAALARGLAARQGWIPEKLHGLDGFAGCASLPQDGWFTPEILLLAGLVGGAFAAVLMGGQFACRRPRWNDVARGLGGGVLLGWGAMTGLGCTIGTLLSGTQAGAVSGWVFGTAMLIAIVIGRQKFAGAKRPVTELSSDP
ncbi:MAG: YeeE/YedE family protein [Candidatus Accumulibacter sp.]|nr:YeeE/YedE family protein [Accumulibacter sp.]